MEPGEFVWTGGDCHIYSNHLEQVKKQLGYGTDPEGNPYPPREPYPVSYTHLDVYKRQAHGRCPHRPR